MDHAHPIPDHRSEECVLKADPTAQLRLLDLQTVDSTLDQLAHRLATLPESATLAALVERRDELATEVTRLQTEVADLGRDQRKADADVEQVKTRRQRNRERIDAGQVGDPKQLQALQHEMESLDRRISDLEDVELEVMETLETTQDELATRTAELADLDVEIGSTQQAVDAASADIARLRAEAEEERAALAAEIPQDLGALYVRLRAQLGGVGVGAIERKRCTGCRLDIGAAELARMSAASPDEVLRCEECNRILVRTADSGLG